MVNVKLLAFLYKMHSCGPTLLEEIAPQKHRKRTTKTSF